jgi:hypothetical protein
VHTRRHPESTTPWWWRNVVACGQVSLHHLTKLNVADKLVAAAARAPHNQTILLALAWNIALLALENTHARRCVHVV